MADLAIGVSKTALDLVVSKVKEAKEEEEEQWQIVQHDLVFITGEFEMMQSFLNTADRERIKNLVVRTWVRQVRDLSYDVEDWIEFVLHLDTKQSWWSWWPRLLPSFWWSCWPRLLQSSTRARATMDLDEAVSMIKHLKSQVMDVSQRNTRYNLISDSGSKPAAQVLQTVPPSKRAFEIPSNAHDKGVGPWSLAHLLNRSDMSLQVISVCGSGGDLGTIPVIRELYCVSEVSKNFHCRAWVKIMDPFNNHQFIGSLEAQFCKSCRQQNVELTRTVATEDDLAIKECAEKMNLHRYLIVLEGLSSKVQWDAIKTYLPDKKNRSRIIVLTHQVEIATVCTGKPYGVFMLQQHSSADHPSCVFYRENPKRRLESANCSKTGDNHVGREVEKRMLYRLINERPHSYTSLWGPPGVGKTALMRAVYNSQDRFERKIWVDVSDPFNSEEFCQTLIAEFCTNGYITPDHLERMAMIYHNMFGGELSSSSDDIILKCRYLISRRIDYLLVIDGLRAKENWDWIRGNLIRGPTRCCIVTITRDESIAAYCAETSKDALYRVKGLDADAALGLFMESFKGNETLKMDQILSMCSGLPTFVTALAIRLAKVRKHEDASDLKIMHLEDSLMHELTNNPKFDCLTDLFAWLHSNFHTSPPLLKKCIFYLSIFPEHRTIRRKRIVRRWIAERYSKGTSSSESVEDAEKLFDKIVGLGVIWPRQTVITMAGVMRMTSWQVNSMFLEHIISGQTEEKTFLPLEVSILDERRGPTREHIGQHLAIGCSWERDEFVYSGLDFSRLRSLTVSGVWHSFFISEKMRVLRVLDLEDASGVTNGDLEKIMNLLLRLMFLSLRGCKNITCLPYSLGNLLQLQTLDIRDTGVDKLPKSIIRLRNMQYLRAGRMEWDYNGQGVKVSYQPTPPSPKAELHTPVDVEEIATPAPAEEELQTPQVTDKKPPTPRKKSWTSPSSWFSMLRRHPNVGARCAGVGLPVGFWKLTALHTLGVVNVNTVGGKAALEELKNHTQLRKLGVSGNSRSIKFPKSLQSLKLYGRVERLPRSIKDLKSLEKLNLEIITLTQMEVQVLGELEKLHTLRLRVQGAELQFPGRQVDAHNSTPRLFPELQVLDIACTNSFHVMFGEGAMDKLEVLVIRCFRPVLQLSGPEHLVSLNQVLLRVGGSHAATLKATLQRQLDSHPNNPVLKQEE